MDKDKKFIIRDELDKDPEFKEKWDMLDPEMQQYYLDVQDGKRVVSLYNDAVFKNIFDADTKKQRLSQLISLIIGKKVTVLNSLKNEGIQQSVYSKKKILDLAAQLENGEYVNIEMQVSPDPSIGNRMTAYFADLLSRQFSIDEGEIKKEINFKNIKEVYMIALMKKSPKEFLVAKEYHHSARVQMNSNVEFMTPLNYYFVELDKYLEQNQGKILDNIFGAWIAFIGTDDLRLKMNIMDRYPEFRDVHKEIIEMSFDRKGMLAMTNSTLELMEKNTIYLYGKEEGLEEGLEKGRKKLIKILMDRGIAQDELEDILEQY